MLLRRRFLSLLGGLVLGACLLGNAPAHAEATQADASKFIEKLADNAITMVADKSLSETSRNDRFRTLFEQSFDIPAIGKFVLARYWKAASPDQQQEFLRLFEDMNVLTWAKRFKDYSGEKLQVTNANKDAEHGDWLVESKLQRVQGPPVVVQWRLHEVAEGLRVTDIFVEGVSMAQTSRQDYSATLQGNGGKLDALLSAMRTKIDQMKAAG